MANIKIILDFFLLSIAWTLTLFSPIASSKLTGNGLIKLITNTAIGALSLSLFLNTNLVLKLIALTALIGISFFHRDQKTFFMWILYSVVSLILGFLIISLASLTLLNSFFLISSAFLLGIILYSMLLGHWYLVVPKLSETPLKIAGIILWGILLLKILFSFLSAYNHFDFFEEQTTLGAGYAFNWVLLLMRVLFGYIVILSMSVFNWKLVEMRSIQSSTGILYAMTFFVFIGELVSTYLFFNFGLFI